MDKDSKGERKMEDSGVLLHAVEGHSLERYRDRYRYRDR